MSLIEPKIVCIMPCYNAEKTLAKAIESVTKQNYSNWELIIVDDASTDKSVKIAKKYLKDSRVTLLQNKTNRGCYYSRNRALYHVKDKEWDWFTVHDSDDTSHPDRFGIIMAHAFHGKYDYLYSCANGNRYNFSKRKLEYKKWNNAVGISFVSYNLFTTLGFFDPNTRFSADSEYEYRYLVILTSNLSQKLNTNNIDDVQNYCYENKVFMNKLDIKYSYLYTCGFVPGANLTHVHSYENRVKYRDSFETKWGNGGVAIEKFYQNFEPQPEDIIL